MNHFEAVLSSVFYPFTLYAGLRLAHRGFTVGELGLVCFGGTALCLEFLHLTIAKACYPIPFHGRVTYRLSSDLASHNTIHPNVPTSQPTADFSDRLDCRFLLNWLPALAFPGPLS